MDDNRPRILIIDDEPQNLQLLDELLKSEYMLSFATNGLKGLEVLKKTNPHLILLDIMMPKMDGFEFCGCIKKDEQTREIPVIFISALSRKEELDKCFAAGGADFIAKPFLRDEILKKIRKHLKVTI